MSEYTEQAKKFLEDCNAKMKITYLGGDINSNWGDNCYRNKYLATITTPLGRMGVTFWDSIYNTERDTEPTVYDILSCLEDFDGTIDDFVSEFGYEVAKWEDVKRIKNTYNAVIRQTKSLHRCFTEEQIEKLMEIR